MVRLYGRNMHDIFHLKNDLLIFLFICHFILPHRKSTFDMFNFLASQHRQLPDTDLYDEEEDEVLLKSSRLDQIHTLFSVLTLKPLLS